MRGDAFNIKRGITVNSIISVTEFFRDITENKLQQYFNLLLSGENGVGKEYYARKIHELSKGKEKFLMIDFEIDLSAQQKAVDSLVKKHPEEFLQTARKNTWFFRRFDFLEEHLLLRIQDFFRTVSSCQIDKEIHFLKLGILCSVDESPIKQVNKLIENALQEFFVLKVAIPPLRERAVELSEMIKEVIRDFDQKSQEKFLNVASQSKDILARYSWPGNLNELRSVLEEVCLLIDNEAANLGSFFEKKLGNGLIYSSAKDHKDFHINKKGKSEKCLSGTVCCTYYS